MPPNNRHRLRTGLALIAAASLGLMSCGVSGKASDLASPTTAVNTPATQPETPQNTEPKMTLPESTTTTEPTTSTPDSSDPNNSLPFDTGDVRKTLTRLYKSLGMTDKEVKCALKLTLDSSGGPAPSDPTNFDISKYLRCFGPDGIPGGSD